MKRLLIAAVMIAATTGCKSEIDGKTAATVSEPSIATAAQQPEGEGAEAPATTKVPLDVEKSAVEWVGAKVTGDHTGKFETFTGEAEFNAEGKLHGISVEIDTTSVVSDNEKLTEHLKSGDFFEVEKFPKSTFQSTSITHNDDGSMSVTGDLDLRGVKKSITFPATATTEGGIYTAKSEFTLQRFDFGIEYKGQADDLIKPEVLMKLTVAAPVPAQ